MRRFTTSEETYTIEGVNLTGCRVIVSYTQKIGRSNNAHEVHVSDTSVSYDGTDTIVTVNLTQEQTGGFMPGRCQVEVNWISPDGKREGTEIITVGVEDNLLREVMAYGE